MNYKYASTSRNGASTRVLLAFFLTKNPAKTRSWLALLRSHEPTALIALAAVVNLFGIFFGVHCMTSRNWADEDDAALGAAPPAASQAASASVAPQARTKCVPHLTSRAAAAAARPSRASVPLGAVVSFQGPRSLALVACAAAAPPLKP